MCSVTCLGEAGRGLRPLGALGRCGIRRFAWVLWALDEDFMWGVGKIADGWSCLRQSCNVLASGPEQVFTVEVFGAVDCGDARFMWQGSVQAGRFGRVRPGLPCARKCLLTMFD